MSLSSPRSPGRDWSVYEEPPCVLVPIFFSFFLLRSPLRLCPLVHPGVGGVSGLSGIPWALCRCVVPQLSSATYGMFLAECRTQGKRRREGIEQPKGKPAKAGAVIITPGSLRKTREFCSPSWPNCPSMLLPKKKKNLLPSRLHFFLSVVARLPDVLEVTFVSV